MTDGDFGEGRDIRPRLVGKALADAVNSALDAVFYGDLEDIKAYLRLSTPEMAEDMVRYDADLDNQDPVDLISYIDQYLREHELT